MNGFDSLYTDTQKPKKPNVTYNYRQCVKKHTNILIILIILTILIFNNQLKLILIPTYYRKLEAVCMFRGLLMMGA
jgi:hypothetical protein